MFFCGAGSIGYEDEIYKHLGTHSILSHKLQCDRTERWTYFFPFLGAACERALPAAFFEFLPVLLSLRTLEAALAAPLLVFLCLAIMGYVMVFITPYSVYRHPDISQPERKGNELSIDIICNN